MENKNIYNPFFTNEWRPIKGQHVLFFYKDKDPEIEYMEFTSDTKKAKYCLRWCEIDHLPKYILSLEQQLANKYEALEKIQPKRAEDNND